MRRKKCMIKKAVHVLRLQRMTRSVIVFPYQISHFKCWEIPSYFLPVWWFVQLVRCNSIENNQPEMIKEKCEVKEVVEPGFGSRYFDLNEKEALLKEIEGLKSKLSYSDASHNKSVEKLRSSLLSRSIQLRKSGVDHLDSKEELESERQRWTEMESDWISLTDELRIDLESHRRRAEKVELELTLEKRCTEELDDALHRSVLGHARMIEHYAELQDKYNDLVGKHRAIMEGIAEVKKAAAKAGKKGHGSRFAKSLAAELSALRVERERERELLKKENKSLRIQLRDTAEAVHAAGELLVRLREAEQAASISEVANCCFKFFNRRINIDFIHINR
jgi:kinesin family protein 15